jgi:sulfate adenylyltransferase subunit 2
MPGRPDKTDELNLRRRRAVEMRIAGATLADITAEVDLSAPTIIAAHKAWQSGGWEAVDTRPRGRPKAGSAGLSATEKDRLHAMLGQAPDANTALWSIEAIRHWLTKARRIELSPSSVASMLAGWQLSPVNHFAKARSASADSDLGRWMQQTYPTIVHRSRARGAAIFWLGRQRPSDAQTPALIYAHSPRGKQFWLPAGANTDSTNLLDFLNRLHTVAGQPLTIIASDIALEHASELQNWQAVRHDEIQIYTARQPLDEQSPAPPHTDPAAESSKHPRTEQSESPSIISLASNPGNSMNLTHLQRLEAESIHIMREVVAETDNPVMLYSVGKDSNVMLRLAQKAFYPAPLPFPLLHIDTGWKFRELIEFRDQLAKDQNLDLIIHTNPDGVAKGVNPFSHGSALHTSIMKTEALRQAMDQHRFDAAFGGARRDEEAARAKERVFSFRDSQHRWDPKNQRPELWNLYNSKVAQGESIRVFPLSNWTELDIWHYIYREEIALPSLYYSAERPVVERDSKLIMVDDERLPMNDGEVPQLRNVRFRTTGCYPLTGALESDATSIPQIMEELLHATTSERLGRTIDSDQAASMERKKQEGYF